MLMFLIIFWLREIITASKSVQTREAPNKWKILSETDLKIFHNFASTEKL